MNAVNRQFGAKTLRKLRSAATLLLAVAFVFSQSVAQQHIHVDGELTASCVVCHHADNSPAVTANVSTALSIAQPVFLPGPSHVTKPVTALTHDHLSRAPPATS